MCLAAWIVVDICSLEFALGNSVKVIFWRGGGGGGVVLNVNVNEEIDKNALPLPYWYFSGAF